MNQVNNMMRIFLFLVCGLLLIACGKPIKEEVGYGSLNNNTYVNKYLNISIALPENWVIADRAKLKQILEEDDEMMKEKGVIKKLITKFSQARTITLFSSSEIEILQDEFTFTPSIIALSEKASDFIGIKKTSDYIEVVKEGLLESGLPYQFSNNHPSGQYAGMIFDTLSGNIESDKYLGVYQDYYVTKIKGYMLIFIMSYVNEEDKKIMLDSLKSLKRLNNDAVLTEE